MNHVQMKERYPDSTWISNAILRGHCFRINERGVATIVSADSKKVYGALWKISENDKRSLDCYEGVEPGFYKEITLEIENLKGGQIEALSYMATDSMPGSPREGYIEMIISAAEYYGFPDEYILQLKSWRNSK